MSTKLSRRVGCLLVICCLTSVGCSGREQLSEPTMAVENIETADGCPESLPPEPTIAPAEKAPSSEPVAETSPEGDEKPGAPGFFWEDGVLFCRDENGVLLRDAEKDSLYFSESGAYTSGSETLDILVAETLSKLISENPGHEREELLRDVYDVLVSDRYSYLGLRVDAVEGEPWEAEAAVTMLEGGRGNCHHYAAAFWALSRGLGYPAITHTNPSGQRHSWTEIEIDSVRYIFDPQLAVHWKDERFMLSYDQCRQKNYTVYFSGVTAGY